MAVFYSPTHSVRGAKLCVVKEPKKRAVDDFEIDRPIITPHALPMFKDDQPRSSKRKREKLRKDPKISHRPGTCKSGYAQTCHLHTFRTTGQWPWKGWSCGNKRAASSYRQFQKGYHKR